MDNKEQSKRTAYCPATAAIPQSATVTPYQFIKRPKELDIGDRVVVVYQKEGDNSFRKIRLGYKGKVTQVSKSLQNYVWVKIVGGRELLFHRSELVRLRT